MSPSLAVCDLSRVGANPTDRRGALGNRRGAVSRKWLIESAAVDSAKGLHRSDADAFGRDDGCDGYGSSPPTYQ